MKFDKFKRFITIIIAIIICGNFNIASAASSTSSLKQQQAAAAAAAAAAKAAAAQKAAEAAAIQAQINQLQSQINQAQAALNSTNNQVASTEKLIADLEIQIKAQTDNLAAENEKLAKILSSWYMEGDQSGLFNAMISANTLSEVITKQEYYEAVRQQIEISMDKINQLKLSLETQKNEADHKKAELLTLQQAQTDQRNYLSSRKSLQSRLLTDTKNAMSELQNEAKSAEKLAADLQSKINAIEAASSGIGGDLTSVSAGWYYSQTDSRWSDYRIGRYATIGEVGCLLTSLTMVADYYGRGYNPITAAENSSFDHSGGSYDGAMYSTSIVSDGGSQAINWNLLDNELESGHPVVVGLALGVDMGNSFGVSHFVVLSSKLDDGRYAMLDPLGPSRGYSKTKVKSMRIIR